MDKLIYTSLTRIAQFKDKDITIRSHPNEQWANGDYVAATVIFPGSGTLKIELANGRMVAVMKGDILIGSLGVRHATLEATGTWKAVKADGMMHALTGAGLFGKLTSKSAFIPEIIKVQYFGHVYDKGEKATMQRYAARGSSQKLAISVVLFVGTSMSAGKTTAARIFTRALKRKGLKVVGAKLTGAGRYRDILTVKDAGADTVFDFVDVGLPSSICPEAEYQQALGHLLGLISDTRADIAVIEIGASPLEPYNGDTAIKAIKDQVRFSVLCASDPYAVYGVMKSFNFYPDLVTGIATNTLAGIELIEKLCQVKALNIIDNSALPEMEDLLFTKIRDLIS